MPRTYAITGSASGIGAALRDRLEEHGARVIGIDLHDAEVIADPATVEGRAHAIASTAATTDGTLDAVVSCAGIAATEPVVVRVNYFGAVTVVAGLRSLLARGTTPSALIVTSASVVHPVDDALVEACLADDEERACRLPGATSGLAYASSKRALARWVRRQAITTEWAGAAIALNAVAPGTVETPLSAPVLADPTGAAYIDAAVPMPFGGRARPEGLAPLLEFLTGPDCRHVTGQVLFVDGGADAVLAGDDVWSSAPLPEFVLGE
jgi:NAD(P)-dependent dehydrogenase (short-subunit alcohol dehydrogenase family)